MINVRDARFTSHGTGMTARILIGMPYQLLQRASSSIANLTNKRHFLKLDYMNYKDANMEGFLDEVNRRIGFCDDLDENDVEAFLQGELIKSNDLKFAVSRYLKLSQSEHAPEKIMKILQSECEIREVLNRQKYENKVNEHGFDEKGILSTNLRP